MNIETLTPEQLTHDVFKSQIVGLVKKYQKIIDDDTTENDTLKWVNEELEQLSTWLTTLNDIDITVTYENLQEQLLISQNKYDEFVSTLNTKLEEIDQTFEQKENEITQTFNTKLNDIDTTFNDKKDEIIQTFEHKENSITQTFDTIKNSLNQTIQTVQSKLENDEFKGDRGISISKVESINNKLVITRDNGDVHDLGNFTNDYNNLLNKPKTTDLEDYEQGTFTPHFNVSLDIIYTVQSGKYSKVGNIVTLNIRLAYYINSLEIDTDIKLYGVPYMLSSFSDISSEIGIGFAYNWKHIPRASLYNKHNYISFKSDITLTSSLKISDMASIGSINYLNLNATYQID